MFGAILARLSPLLLPLAGAAILALGASLAAQTYHLSSERRAHAETRVLAAQDQREMAVAALKSQQEQAAEFERRIAANREIDRDDEKRLAQAIADAAANADAAQRLRIHAAGLAARARQGCTSSATAGEREAAGAATDLLAELQSRIDEAADGVADFADLAHGAGLSCQRRYDTLTPP